jgi:hypothetical protein
MRFISHRVVFLGCPLSHKRVDSLKLSIPGFLGCPLVSHNYDDEFLESRNTKYPGIPGMSLGVPYDGGSPGIPSILGFLGCPLVSHVTVDHP